MHGILVNANRFRIRARVTKGKLQRLHMLRIRLMAKIGFKK